MGNQESNANQRNNQREFSFVVTTDLHIHLKQPKERPVAFSWACGKISEIGSGAFMITTGDVWDARRAREIVNQHLGNDYPWYLVIGGHDLEYPPTLEFARTYNAHGKTLPNIVNPGPPSAPETTYSFDYGNCHFVVLNQFFDGKSDSGQQDGYPSRALMDWLAKDLDQNKKQHVFVFIHEPAFRHPDMDFHNEQAGGGYMAYRERGPRDRFWQMLRDYHVLGLIHGHHHVYNRARIRGIWDIEAGHCHSMPKGTNKDDQRKRGTFLIFHVNGDEVTYDCYRDEFDGKSFKLYEQVKLAGGEQSVPPTAKATGPIAVIDADGDGQAEIILDGSASHDPSGSIEHYLWEREGQKLAEGKIAKVRMSVGYYRDVSLTVTNDRGVTDREAFPIWVKPQSFSGIPPTVDAGKDQRASQGEPVDLRGTVRHDGKSIPEGKLKIQWNKQDGPGDVWFSESGRKPCATAKFPCPGRYILSLEAFYGGMNSFDTVTITIES